MGDGESRRSVRKEKWYYVIEKRRGRENMEKRKEEMR